MDDDHMAVVGLERQVELKTKELVGYVTQLPPVQQNQNPEYGWVGLGTCVDLFWSCLWNGLQLFCSTVAVDYDNASRYDSTFAIT